MKAAKRKCGPEGNHMFIEYNNYGHAEFHFEAYVTVKYGWLFVALLQVVEWLLA